MTARLLLPAALTLLAGCGSPNQPAPAPTPSPAITASPTAAGPLAPRDECIQRAGFPAFHAALTGAVAKQDAAALAALADPGIRLDFGGDGGRETMLQRLGDPAMGPDLWRELAKIAAWGCASPDAATATYPWFFAHLPDLDDPYSARIVIGDNVALRKGPLETTPLVRKLAWELVTLVPGEARSTNPHAEVVARADKADGYVRREVLRPLNGFRLLAQKTAQGWRIMAFVTGD